MEPIKITKNPEVDAKFAAYPTEVRPKLHLLRKLIIEVATEIPSINEIEETLKWGELRYLVKKGSTIRIDWKSKTPDQYAMYFKCTSKLVPTFKTVFGDLFNYEKDRAIVFGLNDPIPEAALKECIKLALTYHNVKHQPNLGL